MFLSDICQEKIVNNCFESEYCNVKYIAEDNVVLLTWKKFCKFDNYRTPTLLATNLLIEKKNSNFIIDARHGFEDEKEDVAWGFSVLLPTMAKSDCKICVFIMNEVSDIDEEIDLWTKEFQKYFMVKKVLSYEEAVKLVTKG